MRPTEPIPMRNGSKGARSLLIAAAGCAVAATLAACRSLDSSEFLSPSPRIRGLPGAELVYDPALTNESLQTWSGSGRDVGPGLESEREIHAEVERALEAHLAQVFSGKAAQQRVSVRFRVDDQTHPAWGAGMLASFLTLSVVNLLGVPVQNVAQSIDLIVAVGPQEDPLYRAAGSGAAYQAYWYGYDAQDAAHLAALRATRAALEKLDVAIQDDAERLRSRLTLP